MEDENSCHFAKNDKIGTTASVTSFFINDILSRKKGEEKVEDEVDGMQESALDMSKTHRDDLGEFIWILNILIRNYLIFRFRNLLGLNYLKPNVNTNSKYSIKFPYLELKIKWRFSLIKHPLKHDIKCFNFKYLNFGKYVF